MDYVSPKVTRSLSKKVRIEVEGIEVGKISLGDYTRIVGRHKYNTRHHLRDSFNHISRFMSIFGRFIQTVSTLIVVTVLCLFGYNYSNKSSSIDLNQFITDPTNSEVLTALSAVVTCSVVAALLFTLAKVYLDTKKHYVSVATQEIEREIKTAIKFPTDKPLKIIME
ncbi:hypothetical protein [Rosenbergiella collisarenosi]|uniref:hypothetical protein n=1 Tax=Rosenbergiella collisarenosi TaxID=1544695 RepID=UPI001F4EB88C|nr:hypothetical protein [Rosenbergiella collisarenosi]